MNRFSILNALIAVRAITAHTGPLPSPSARAILRTREDFSYHFVNSSTHVAYLTSQANASEVTYFKASTREEIEQFIDAVAAHRTDVRASLTTTHVAPPTRYAAISVEGRITPRVQEQRALSSRDEWSRLYSRTEPVSRPANINDTWELLEFSRGTNPPVFLARDIAGSSVTCAATNEVISLRQARAYEMGNNTVYVSTNEARRLGLEKFYGTEELNTLFDVYNPSISIDRGVWVHQRYVDSNPSLFTRSSLGANRPILASTAIRVQTGEVMSPAEFNAFGFTCVVSGELHLRANNPRGASRSVADAHYRPPLRPDVIMPRETDPLNVYGHIDGSGKKVKGAIPSHHKDGKVNKDLYLAMEIEVESGNPIHSGGGASQLMAEELGVCVHDGSLDRETGFELKTVPQVGGISHERMARICEIFAQHKIHATPRCGVHIHVARAALTELQISRIARFMFKHGNAAFIELIAGRGRDNRYAPFNKSVGFMTTFQNGRNDRGEPDQRAKMRNSRNVQSVHYTAFHLGKDATVEFRIFAGSVELSTLKMYQEFVLALIEYTSAGVSECSAASSPAYADFLKFLFDKNRTGRKRYPNLFSFLISKGMVANPSDKQQVAVQSA